MSALSITINSLPGNPTGGCVNASRMEHEFVLSTFQELMAICGDVHNAMMECCQWRKLFVAKNLGIGLLSGRYEGNRPGFMVEFQNSEENFISREAGWAWQDGSLILLHREIVIRNMLFMRNSEFHLEKEDLSLFGELINSSALPLLMAENHCPAGHEGDISKEDIRTQKLLEQTDNGLSAIHSDQDLCYGSESSLDTWWPSWYL